MDEYMCEALTQIKMAAMFSRSNEARISSSRPCADSAVSRDVLTRLFVFW